MMDIIIDFDDDDPRGYRTITVKDYPVDPNADPDPTQVSPEYWCQFAEAVCVAVLHNMKMRSRKFASPITISRRETGSTVTSVSVGCAGTKSEGDSGRRTSNVFSEWGSGTRKVELRR